MDNLKLKTDALCMDGALLFRKREALRRAMADTEQRLPPPVSVPKAGLSVPNRCNIIAFGREVLSVKAHKGKALDGLTTNALTL